MRRTIVRSPSDKPLSRMSRRNVRGLTQIDDHMAVAIPNNGPVVAPADTSAAVPPPVPASAGPNDAAICDQSSPQTVPQSILVIDIGGSKVKVASVATAFPSGQTHFRNRLAEVRGAVADGADEIDMVINRGAFLSGDYSRVQDEIAAVVGACGASALKVILEVSELETFDSIRAASFLAMGVLRPGDFIKTSTGFSTGGATPEDVALMRGVAGGRCGVKASGGVRTLEDARRMLEAGANRIGASASVAILTELGAN